MADFVNIKVLTVNTETGKEKQICACQFPKWEDEFHLYSLMFKTQLKIEDVYLYDFGVFSVIKGERPLDIYNAIISGNYEHCCKNSKAEMNQQEFYKALLTNLEKLFNGEILEFTVDKVSRFNEYVKVEREMY